MDSIISALLHWLNAGQTHTHTHTLTHPILVVVVVVVVEDSEGKMKRGGSRGGSEQTE